MGAKRAGRLYIHDHGVVQVCSARSYGFRVACVKHYIILTRAPQLFTGIVEYLLLACRSNASALQKLQEPGQRESEHPLSYQLVQVIMPLIFLSNNFFFQQQIENFPFFCSGDVMNLIGCILTDQLPTQKIAAVYYITMDVAILSQYRRASRMQQWRHFTFNEIF